jgi:hypothetical protein
MKDNKEGAFLMSTHSYQIGPIEAKGAFTSDIDLSPTISAQHLATVIEQDRVPMASQPGMRHKYLPLRYNPATGSLQTGGRYLFETYEHAKLYHHYTETFVQEGVPFWERPVFLSSIRFVWKVIGAYDFQDISTAHHVTRFEQWQLSSEEPEVQLHQLWSRLYDQAHRPDLAHVALLYNEEQQLAGLVTTYSIGNQPGPSPLPVLSTRVAAIELLPSVGDILDIEGKAKKIFDRTSLILTIWLPLLESKNTPVVWPNTPFLPMPMSHEHTK